MQTCHEHVAVLIPGLGDRLNKLDLLTLSWPALGVERVLFPMGWYDSASYVTKEKELVQNIKKLGQVYSKVSVVGASAGGSVAFNLMALLPDQIYKAVNNCGRLRSGTQQGFRSFARRTSSSPKFAESVEAFERREPQLTLDQRSRMMTIHPAWGDELVPANTCTLDGAQNKQILMMEHGLTIAWAMLSGAVTEFLLK